MRMLLDYEVLTGYIEATTSRPKSDEAPIKNWTKKDKSARKSMCKKVEPARRSRVQDKKMAKEA